MELKYSIPKYIAKIKMSAKKRVLVEGRDDKAHIKNLLDVIVKGHKVRIDTAENIKGDCKKTVKNNRAKIDKIHGHCKDSDDYNNLYYLCDREYHKFKIDLQISDLMSDHESEGNLSWTLGHSIENYFFTNEILCDAYRFICGSEFKSDAISVFDASLNNALKIIAAITLSARDMGKCTYPAGTIVWSDFRIDNFDVYFDVDIWNKEDKSDVANSFREGYKKYKSVVDSSDDIICSRICRGHTSMLLLQRHFASCLYHVTAVDDASKANRDANNFTKIKETSIANALCESWIRLAMEGKAIYPRNLLENVA